MVNLKFQANTVSSRHLSEMKISRRRRQAHEQLWIVTFRANEVEEPISDTSGGAVIYHGPLGESSGTAKRDLCDPTSSSTTADIGEIGRHRQKVRQEIWTNAHEARDSISLISYAGCLGLSLVYFSENSL